MNFNIKIISLFLLTAICLCSCNKRTTAKKGNRQPKKPNVILIMADDMGYGDLGVFGGDGHIKTPNIDHLAHKGIKFINYHSNGVVCSPTRASLMTGLYPQEVGIAGVITAKNDRNKGMSPKQFTLAELFDQAGYKTAIFGKWHLGYKPKYGPIAQGFDYFWGYVSGNVDYKSHIDQTGRADWWHQTKLTPEKGYTTNLITKHAIQFMKKVDGNPFFLYMAEEAPHYPLQAPGDSAVRTIGDPNPIFGTSKNPPLTYKKQIESLDKNIGKVINYLKENDLLKSTIVIFFSDNGAAKRFPGSNAPFRGYKASVLEGGQHEPAIIYWKGVTHPRMSNELVMSMDIFPTVADLLNIDLQDLPTTEKISGISITPIIFNKKGSHSFDKRIVFWKYRNQKAALKGNKWKLDVINGEASLYNLSQDVRETVDLKKEHPKIFHQMKGAISQWESGLDTSKIVVR